MSNTKAAFIAIVGVPNVGKSTLLNQLVGEKVSIVTNKPQTTRNSITGVITNDNQQLIFLDTPGWHKSTNRLGDYMINQVKKSMSGVDLAIMITDPVSSVKPEELQLMKSLKQREIPTILVINKIDRLDQKELMIPKIDACSKLLDFKEIVPISAKNGEGTENLLKMLYSYTKASPHFFDSDDYTNQPERAIISEIIREKLLLNLQQELPHGMAVGIESMEQRPDKPVIDIHATIYCERASHKGMVIGKQGSMLKKIGSQARSDIENFLDCKVNLQCWVKIKEDWRNSENIIKQLGFE